MNAYFFKEKKRRNSTKLPQSDGTLFPINILDANDILNPRIKLRVPNAVAIYEYNYASIDAFGRFYFINNWTFSGGFWYADCSVDVLATYKDAIGGLNVMVERAFVAHDALIPNEDLAILPNMTLENVLFSSVRGVFRDTAPGLYIVSIIGAPEYGEAAPVGAPGVVTHYAMTAAEFAHFCDILYGNSDFWNAVKVWASSPLDYIVGVRWYPLAYPNEVLNSQYWAQTTAIKFGTIPLEVSAHYPLASFRGHMWNFAIDIPEHPGANSGFTQTFLNYSPYTRLSLMWQPFGNIVIEPALFSEDSRMLTLEILTDFTTGEATWRLYAGGTVVDGVITKAGEPFAEGVFKLGIDTPLVKKSYDIGGIVSGGLSLATGIAAASPIGIAGGAISIASSFMPQIEKAGAIDSRIAFANSPIIKCEFANIAETHAQAYRGLPLYKTRYINTLSGFVKCADPAFSSDKATFYEAEQVNNFLTGGFIYE